MFRHEKELVLCHRK